MLLLSEKQLRRVIREEFERFMELPEKPPDVISIKAETGADILLPNYIKDQLDEGKVESIKDII